MKNQKNLNELVDCTFEGLFEAVRKQPDSKEKYEAFTIDQTFMGFNGNHTKSIDTPIDTAFELYMSEEFEIMMNVLFNVKGKDNYHLQVAKVYIEHFEQNMKSALDNRFQFMITNYKCNIIMHFINLLYNRTGVLLPEDIFTTSIDNPYISGDFFQNIKDYIHLCGGAIFTLGSKANPVLDCLTKSDIEIISDDIISNNVIAINTALFTELSQTFTCQLYKQPSAQTNDSDMTTTLETKDQFNIIATKILNEAISCCAPVLLLELSNVCYDLLIVMDRMIYINQNYGDLMD